MLIDNVLEADVGCLVEVSLEQELDELEEDLVAVVWLHRLVLRHNSLVVDDLDLELDALSSEVLRIVVFGRQVTTDLPHSSDFGYGEVLSREARSAGGLVSESHEDVGVDMLPVFPQNLMEILLRSMVLRILQVESTHEEVQFSVATDGLNVFLHEELSFAGHVVPQAKLGVLIPLLSRRVAFLRQKVLQVSLRVHGVRQLVVLSGETLELVDASLLKVLVQSSLLLVLLDLMRDNQVIVRSRLSHRTKSLLKELVLEGLHLLLDESVQLSLKLFFKLLGRQAIVIHLLVVLLDG